MKVLGERILRNGEDPNGELDKTMRLRIEDIGYDYLSIEVLKTAQLKVTSLGENRNYLDEEPNDMWMDVKVLDGDKSGFTGRLAHMEKMRHGGKGEYSIYDYEIEVNPNFYKSIDVVHEVEIEENDPDQYGLMLYLQQLFESLDGETISEAEASAIADHFVWTNKFSAKKLNEVLGIPQPGTFKAVYKWDTYFSGLKYLYQGKNEITDKLLQKWLPFAQMLVEYYDSLPEEVSEREQIFNSIKKLIIDWEIDVPEFLEEREDSWLDNYFPRKESAFEYLKELLSPNPFLKIIGDPPPITDPLGYFLGILHGTIRRFANLTNTQVKYFKKSSGRDVPSESPVWLLQTRNLLNLSMQVYFFDPIDFDLLGNKEGIESGSSSLLEDYTREGDEEVTTRLQDLITKMERIDGTFLSTFLDSYEYTGSRLLFPLWQRKDLIGDPTNDKVTHHDLDQMLHHFQFHALSKAFTYLAENEDKLNEEIDRYSDSPKKLRHVAKLIKGQKVNLRNGVDGLKDILDQVVNITYWITNGTEEIRKEAQKAFDSLYNGLSFSRSDLSASRSDEDKLTSFLLVEDKTTELQTFLGKFWGIADAYREIGGQATKYIPMEKGASQSYYVAVPLEDKLDTLKTSIDGFCTDLVEPYVLSSNALVKEGVEHGYLVLQDMTFNFATLSKEKKTDDIMAKITEGLNEKLENVGKTRSYLNSDPDKVWELKPLIGMTIKDLGIKSGGQSEMVIMDKMADVASDKMWTSIFIGAISLVLAVAGLFTGGLTTYLGAALWAGSAALGIADFIIEYERYDFGTAANNTSMDPGKELGTVAIHKWALALAGAGVILDFVTVFKAVKNMKNLALLRKINQMEWGSTMKNLAKQDAGKLYDGLLREGYDLASRGFKNKKQFVKAFKRQMADLVNKLDPNFAKFLIDSNLGKQVQFLAQPGLNKLWKKLGEADFLKLFEAGNINPAALNRIGLEVSLNKHMLDAVVRLGSEMVTESARFGRIVNSVGGTHTHLAGHFPDLMRIIGDGGAMKYPDLVEIILTDSRYQFALLDDAENMSKLITRWKNWIKNGPGKYKSKTFDQFVQAGSMRVPLNSVVRPTLLDEFGKTPKLKELFESAGRFSEKNMAVLEAAYPGLHARIVAGKLFSDNPAANAAVLKILNKNIIGTVTDFQYAGNKILAEIYTEIGKTAKLDELYELSGTGARIVGGKAGSVFDFWLVANAKGLGKGLKIENVVDALAVRKALEIDGIADAERFWKLLGNKKVNDFDQLLRVIQTNKIAGLADLEALILLPKVKNLNQIERMLEIDKVTDLSQLRRLLEFDEIDDARFLELLLRRGDIPNPGKLESSLKGAIPPALQEILRMSRLALKRSLSEKEIAEFLGDGFIRSLEQFGKSRVDILSYFQRYQKETGFLEFAEVFLSNHKAITRDEVYAIWGYTTNFFYGKLNAMLRGGTEAHLSGPLKTLLESGLSKMPKYQGPAYRSLELNGPALDGFIKTHWNQAKGSGKTVRYDDFLSSGSIKDAAFGNKSSKNVHIEFENVRGPDISDLADGIHFRGYKPSELLLIPGKEYKVLNYFELDGQHFFKLIEL